ncbi:hypothetical protein [Caulobacter phage Cr30]|uniref:hypothetical protein n=1 Tax=Caulobacter phage Cr30 TaxID=1357714 RepID=UPI0004A9B89F|nr:hypothetical protein OZ74_gp269 [Caulobacter phage Cr30]AGS81074.1 hypothetical protein [Caulobacter phage Cr30]
MAKRTFNEDGTFSKEADDAVRMVNSKLREIFDVLETEGFNGREACHLIQMEIMAISLAKVICQRKK